MDIGRYFVVVLIVIVACHASLSQDKRRIIVDADTGNEVDDAYAIARLLIDPGVEIIALNATQWQASHWAVDQSMEDSYRLNKMILGYTRDGHQIKALRGGVNRMFDWGDKAQHSAATYNIIQEADRLNGQEKLDIIVLGALTNVASAVLIEPGIAAKLRIYWLGTTYDFEQGVLKKTDFNCVMDIQALDVMLHSTVEMHIMPHSTAVPLRFHFEETSERLGDDPLSQFLIDRWKYHKDGARLRRTLWDIAIVTAYLRPEWTEQVTIKTSKENGGRVIGFYKSINAEAIKEDFFKAYHNYMDGE